MLDWLSSKVGMIFAAGVITAAMIGFFVWQQDNFQNIERQNTADKIAQQIDLVSFANGEQRNLVTFDPEKMDIGTFMESTISQERFSITILTDMVVLRQGASRQFVSSLHRTIHCTSPVWARSMEILDQEQLDAMDRGNISLEFNSGQDFYIESVALIVARQNEAFETQYHTFIYLA